MTPVLATTLSVIGSLFTAFSILWGIHVYRRQQNKLAVATLRGSLVDLRRLLGATEMEMTEGALSEIGFSISEEIRTACPDDFSKDDLLSFLDLTNEKTCNYAITAIHLGILNSKVKTRAQAITDQLNQIPIQNEIQMPAISAIISNCLLYVTTTVHRLTSAEKYIVALRSEGMSESLKEGMETISTPKLMYREVAEVFSGLSQNDLTQFGRNIYQSAQVILLTLVEALLKKSDADLVDMRDFDMRIYGAKDVDRETSVLFRDFPVDEIFHYLKLLKEQLDLEQAWDDLIQARTRIIDAAHTSEDDPDLDYDARHV